MHDKPTTHHAAPHDEIETPVIEATTYSGKVIEIPVERHFESFEKSWISPRERLVSNFTWMGAKTGAMMGLVCTLPFALFARHQIVPKAATTGLVAGGLMTCLWTYYQLSQRPMPKEFMMMENSIIRHDPLMRTWDAVVAGSALMAGGSLYWLQWAKPVHAVSIGVGLGTLIYAMMQGRMLPVVYMRRVYLLRPLDEEQV